MKKLILFAIFFLLPFYIFAQMDLTGALGLKFGMNMASVKEVLNGKGGVFVPSESDSSSVAYICITMGSLQINLVVCLFINDKLYRIGAIFYPPIGVNTQEVFDNIESIIETKYGEPRSIREFISPYSDGQGDVADAVIAGKATINSSWNQFNNSSSINLEIRAIESYVVIMLYYTDGILMKEIDSKNAKDF